LDPLPAPCRLRLGKGPIVREHTPSLERSRGGGGCRFVVIRASDHSAIVGRVAYFRSPAPFSSAGGRIPQNYRITSSGLKWRPESLPESLPTYSPSGSRSEFKRLLCENYEVGIGKPPVGCSARDPNTRTPPLPSTRQLLTNRPRYVAAYVRNRPQNWESV
jgi:hypothetical protein